MPAAGLFTAAAGPPRPPDRALASHHTWLGSQTAKAPRPCTWRCCCQFEISSLELEHSARWFLAIRHPALASCLLCRSTDCRLHLLLWSLLFAPRYYRSYCYYSLPAYSSLATWGIGTLLLCLPSLFSSPPTEPSAPHPRLTELLTSPQSRSPPLPLPFFRETWLRRLWSRSCRRCVGGRQTSALHGPVNSVNLAVAARRGPHSGYSFTVQTHAIVLLQSTDQLPDLSASLHVPDSLTNCELMPCLHQCQGRGRA